MTRTLKYIQQFIAQESAAGFLLLAMAGLAMLAANSPLASFHTTLMNYPLGASTYAQSLQHWVNDALMVLFFLLVGLEIKRELLEGNLSKPSDPVLPLVAALGGVILPALLFISLNIDTEYAPGWAIPTATDIAFSLAILQLFGSRVPLSLKVFLTAIAVIDDLIAVIVIALFYGKELAVMPLGVAIVTFNVLLLLNYYKVNQPLPYILLGLGLWAAVAMSGIHPTIAGVLLGLAIPLRAGRVNQPSLLKRMEKGLHPWVAYIVLPLFAFCNSGVSLSGLTFSSLFGTLPFGIILGLFLGKQLGIFASVYAMVKLRFARLPHACSWKMIYGVSLLAGIGFTMSLFIGALAFPGAEEENMIRLGIIVGSTLSAVVGYAFLHYALPKATDQRFRSSASFSGSDLPSK